MEDKNWILKIDSLKNNYRIVKYLIEKYKTDYNFISLVATTYLNNNYPNNINYKELVIIVSDILKNDSNNDNYLYFKALKEAIYSNDTLTIKHYKNSNAALKANLNIGKGFFIILSNYSNSSVIMNFYAKRFIDEIFYKDSYYSLEELVHKRFKSADELKKCGINNFLIKYICSHDIYLGNYVSSNLYLLDEIKNHFKYILENFDNYINVLNSKRIDIFYLKARNYFEKNSYGIRFSFDEIVNYTILKSNYSKIFSKYTKLNFNKKIDDKNLYLKEISCINYLEDLLNKLFEFDVYLKENEFSFDFRKKGVVVPFCKVKK